MDTVRVNICYRPLRIAWAIESGDKDSFRRAVRLSHALWGGRFNPIVFVDREQEADRLVDLFRADVILPLSDTERAREFPKRYPYIISPFFPDGLFVKGMRDEVHSHVLDLLNLIAQGRDTPAWKAIEERGLCRYLWDAADPLAEIFLMQFGAYPNAKEIGIDYFDVLSRAIAVTDVVIDATASLDVNVLAHPSLAYLSRHGLRRHYSVRTGQTFPGFFVGDSTQLDDLVCFWNLRASDIPLQFVDLSHLSRVAAIIPEYRRQLEESLKGGQGPASRVAIWSRGDIDEAMRKPFGSVNLLGCPVSDHLWNGLNVRPPMMYFGEATALGVVSRERGTPRVSFSLNDKPFSGEQWFHSQHLVASIALIGGVYDEPNYTFQPPYIPELNEFLARTMHLGYSELRVEPERVGLIIDAADHDASLSGLPTTALVQRIFGLADFDSRPSGAGLIAQQLFSRLGELGARVFKIPGVRRLLRQYGPATSFTKGAALQIIGGKDPDNPQARFSDHHNLHFEARPSGQDLTPDMAFAYMVEKGLFRIGADLVCSTCRLTSWTALDALKQAHVCELCGTAFDATRQLVNGEFHYRRTGVLGLEKNSQGAVPVALVLQQLTNNLGGGFHGGLHAVSHDLAPKQGVALPTCEVDFVVLLNQSLPNKPVVLIGEVKDIGGSIDTRDIENLRQVADALLPNRLETFIVFAKLGPFSDEEIALARTLNSEYQNRVILLTARELEPYRLYERTEKELGIKARGSSAEDLASVTAQIYFKDP
jgi:hypothetical protein